MNKPFTQWTTQDISNYLRKLDPKTRAKVLGTSVGGLVFVIFILWPAWIGRFGVHSKIDSLKSQVQFAKAQILQEPLLREEKKKQEEFVGRIRSRLFYSEEKDRIPGILAELAKRSGVVVLEIFPDERESVSQIGEATSVPLMEGYEVAYFGISVQGGYHGIATLVSEIENFEKILKVDEFSLTPQEEDPLSHLGEIRLSVFFLKEKKR